MAFYDLRGFISKLEKEKEIARVKAVVDPELEIGAIMRKVFDKRGKAVLFENVKGHQIPLLSGAMDTYKRYAMAIECQPSIGEILKKAVSAAKNPVSPIIVKDGPSQELVFTGSKIDLHQFPSPKWHSSDGGKFIGTLGVVITRDPETGLRNMGIYREQLHGKARLGIQTTQQLGIILSKYRNRGKAMPVVTAIGVDPSILAASCFRSALGDDELGIAGALRGEPVPLVKCKTIDLEAPATAEIIIEGEVPPDEKDWDTEGPFGEFTGYYAGMVAKMPTINVTAVTMRSDPIYQGTLEGKPPCESTTMRAVGHTAGIWAGMEKARIPGFKAMWMTDMGCVAFMTVIQLEKQFYAGNARQAIMAFWSMCSHAGKWVVVVDGDIDIFDRGQVEWAISTRVQPHRDIIITPDRDRGLNLDPSIPPEARPYPNTRTSRIGIDATTQFKGFDYSPLIAYEPDLMEKVERRWDEYGIA